MGEREAGRDGAGTGGTARAGGTAAHGGARETGSAVDGGGLRGGADGERVRVLWLTDGLAADGPGRLLVTGARHADRSRYEIEVAHLGRGGEALLPELDKAGVPVHRLTGALWPLRLRALLERRRYALVHTHAPVPAAAARLLVRGRRSGTVLVHTRNRLWHRHRLPARLADAVTLRRGGTVLAVSRTVAASVRPGRDRIRVVPHWPASPAGPADDARILARRALRLPGDAVVIGAVGALTPRKDHRTLLDAYALMRRNHSGTVLVLVGSGPLEAGLRRHAASLGLRDAVVFAGERADAPSLLPALDVFALSSREEGLPVALLEAMAWGLPSAATRVDGVAEVLTDGAQGLLVRPGDAEALAVALGRLASTPALRARVSASARERARHFDPAGAQRAVEAVYEELLAPGGTAAPAEPAREEAPHSPVE
ncbi:glycosyltransferase [Streptomyces capparidis]